MVAVPTLGVALLGAVLYMRRPEAPKGQVRVASTPAPEKIHEPAGTAPLPQRAPASEIAQATKNVRIRGTYQNYRQSVATNDAALQKSLLPILLKDREGARQCAQEDLARARSSSDREIAQKVLESLR